MATSTILLCFCALICSAFSSKILVVFPIPAQSHFSLGARLATALSERGHQVTMISPFPQKTPGIFRDISVEDNLSRIKELQSKLFDLEHVMPFTNMKLVLQMGVDLTEHTLRNAEVQKLLKSDETFDLVIMEHFCIDSMVGFGHRFKAPVVFLEPMGAGILNNHLVANPAPASYIPNLMGRFTKRMDFWQRVENVLLNGMFSLLNEFDSMRSHRVLFQKYFGDEVELDAVLYNVSLILTNSHVSVNDAVPHVPNMIEIGGYHVKPPKKLPQDLQEYLDRSTQGVVIFSMGSNLKSKDLKPEMRTAFLNAFSKIKENVIWKFEDDLADLPKNVKIMKWLPQQDILAHPNVKVFISHGGLLSTIETIYHGVPVIGIPVFGDQKTNIAAAVSNGYAVSVPISQLTEERLSNALDEILNNPKYRENAQRRARIMKDQPMKPIDLAVFWLEYVIRHQGAPELRVAGLDLVWYKREMIDIAVLLTLITIALFALFYIIIRKLLRAVFGRKTQQALKNKKTK